MSTSSKKSNPGDNIVDLLVYAPVGIALEAVDNLPKFIERGRSQITLGRFVARTAARKGSSTIESIGERLVNDAGQVVVDLFGIDLTPERDDETAVVADVEPLADLNDDLPIAEYDSQAAAQIVKLLPQLTADEREAIAAYEVEGRNRVTILRKIEQLRDAA